MNWALAGQLTTAGIVAIAVLTIGYKIVMASKPWPIPRTPEQEATDLQERVRHSAQWEPIYDQHYE